MLIGLEDLICMVFVFFWSICFCSFGGKMIFNLDVKVILWLICDFKVGFRLLEEESWIVVGELVVR